MAATKLLEKDVQSAVMDWLSVQPGVRVWRQNTGGLHWKDSRGKDRYQAIGRKGQADISGIHAPSGRRIEVECKATGKKPSEKPGEDHQARFLAEVRESGGIAFYADSLEMCIEKWGQQL